MTRFIGNLLGVSFQTELLIMTLLGLANSTLNWKPLELMLRLNLIRDMHFSMNDVHFKHDFTSKIKKLLTLTVVIEFFCSLVNPFTYLLKLYPIITLSRSDILLPWLVTHALNTLLPKILSVSLALFFYSENAISTMSLIEFLLVETINFIIAGYNWYIFFEFYMELREVDRKRFIRKNQIKATDNLPQTRSSFSSIREIFRESSLTLTELEALRNAKSMTSLLDSQILDLIPTSILSLSMEENLSPAEKSMKILNLTPNELENARKSKHGSSMFNFHDTFVEYKNEALDYVSPDENSVESDLQNNRNTSKANCYCSSSDDDEDSDINIINKHPIKNRELQRQFPSINTKSDSNIISDSKQHRIMKPNNPFNINNDNSTVNTIIISPSISFVLNQKNDDANVKISSLNLLFHKNLEILDNMYRQRNCQFQSVPKNKQLKWSIFWNELDSHLDSTLLKNSDMKIDNDYEHVVNNNTTNNKNTNNNNNIPIIDKGHFEKSKLNSSENLTKLEVAQESVPTNNIENENFIPDSLVKLKNTLETEISVLLNFDKIAKQNCRPLERKSFRSNHTFTRNSLDNQLLNDSKCNFSDILPLKPTNSIKLAEYNAQQKVRELTNLRAYNHSKLERDRREILQKKKKSKMTGYKKSTVELALHNSDAVNINTKRKIADRTCRSTHSREKINRNFNHEQIIHQQNDTLSTINTSDSIQNCIPDLDQFLTEEKVKNIYDEACNSSNSTHQMINSKETYVQYSELLKESFSKVESSSNQMLMDVAQEELMKSQKLSNISELIQKPSSNMREIIKRIDWNINVNAFDHLSPPINIKSHSINRAEEIPEERVIVDDDTVILLRNAFSFSDESKRGFCLGPDCHEPYPIFQVVALTIADSFKASIYRNNSELTSDQRETEDELINPDGVIYCRTMADELFQSGDNGIFDHLLVTPNDLTNNVSEAIEQKKMLSAYLIEQLEERLDSSRKILNATDNLYNFGNIDEKKVKYVDDARTLKPATLLDCLTGFQNVNDNNENIKTDLRNFKTYICTIDDKRTLNQDESSMSEVHANASGSHVLDTKSNSDINTTTKHTNFKSIVNDQYLNHREKNSIDYKSLKQKKLEEIEAKAKEKRRNTVCETKFEHEVITHKFREGNGLSAGNIMEYDSEGRVLTLMPSSNPKLSKKLSISHNTNLKTNNPSNNNQRQKHAPVDTVKIQFEENPSVIQQETLTNSNNNLVKLFYSFYEKFREDYDNTKGDKKFEESLQRLSETEEFSNFISLFQTKNFESKQRDINYDSETASNSSYSQRDYYSATEIQLNTFEFQNNEKILDNIEILKSFDQNNENILENNIKCNLDETEKTQIIKRDNNERMYSAERNANIIHPVNRANILFCEEERKHKESLNSNVISKRIAAWNTESTGSLYSLGFENRKKTEDHETNVSFSNNSDIEDFGTD